MENQGREAQSTEARTRARKHGHAQSADFIGFEIDDQLFYLVKISPWLPAQHTSIAYCRIILLLTVKLPRTQEL